VISGVKGNILGDCGGLSVTWKPKMAFRGKMKIGYDQEGEFGMSYWANGQIKAIRSFDGRRQRTIKFKKDGKREN
jgi:hypothetical protein